MSRLAAASTIPVTSMAQQEKSSKSFRSLVAIVRPHVQRPLKRHNGPSALLYLVKMVACDHRERRSGRSRCGVNNSDVFGADSASVWLANNRNKPKNTMGALWQVSQYKVLKLLYYPLTLH
jgi:hypothetical protein